MLAPQCILASFCVAAFPSLIVAPPTRRLRSPPRSPVACRFASRHSASSSSGVGSLLPRSPMARRPAASRSSLRALSAKVELIEIDLSEDSLSSSSGVEGDSTDESKMGMRRLEDVIHGVLVRRAAPAWLPFVPGGSYWVPPMRRPFRASDLVSNSKVVCTPSGATVDASAMTEEEAMCFTTVRGWPSAAYFVQGKLSHPVKRPRKDATQTDDEEG